MLNQVVLSHEILASGYDWRSAPIMPDENTTSPLAVRRLKRIDRGGVEMMPGFMANNLAILTQAGMEGEGDSSFPTCG